MGERDYAYRLMPSDAEVAAYRAGYERCKQDATTAIKAYWAGIDADGEDAFEADALAVVAALGQQQEAP